MLILKLLIMCDNLRAEKQIQQLSCRRLLAVCFIDHHCFWQLLLDVCNACLSLRVGSDEVGHLVQATLQRQAEDQSISFV